MTNRALLLIIAVAFAMAPTLLFAMNKENNKVTITILQTSDIHGQPDTHQEMFVEEDRKSVV